MTKKDRNRGSLAKMFECSVKIPYVFKVSNPPNSEEKNTDNLQTLPALVLNHYKNVKQTKWKHIQRNSNTSDDS